VSGWQEFLLAITFAASLTSFCALLWVIYTLDRIEKLILKSRLDRPSLLTEQLNRRLLEEHTAELRRFNNSTKGSKS
jgi:hypothetical protein